MESIGGDFLVFTCILDFGKGSKALKLSNELGSVGGTIFLGKGTVKNELLNILGAMEIRKEIFVTIIPKSLEEQFYNTILSKFKLNKPNKGIAFSMPIKYCLEYNKNKYESNPKKIGVNGMDYESIFVIVDKGLSDDVLDAAKSAGLTGGTVIHGRGSGTQEKAKLFNIEIEPEKDIVLMLSETGKTEAIVGAIDRKLNISKPGSGIIFVMDVSRTLGLYQGEGN